MSKFYGQVIGAAQTSATRRGHHDIKTSAQSYDGSVITRMFYDADDRMIIEISLADVSSTYGQSFFCGTMEELKNQLRK